MRLVIPVAAIGVMSTVVTAFAGDKPPRSVGPSGDARQSVSERSESVIRPPALIPPARGHARAIAPYETTSTDQHVAEFLRWKEQHANPRR
jgi:hypothetical protein